MFRFLRKKKQEQPKKVERELWYDLVFQSRAWSWRWHQHLNDDTVKKPKSKDEFIDEMIKKYKLSEREQEHT